MKKFLLLKIALGSLLFSNLSEASLIETDLKGGSIHKVLENLCRVEEYPRIFLDSPIFKQAKRYADDFSKIKTEEAVKDFAQKMRQNYTLPFAKFTVYEDVDAGQYYQLAAVPIGWREETFKPHDFAIKSASEILKYFQAPGLQGFKGYQCTNQSPRLC
ncbi:hypothetical protein IM40_06035 [Candidatus Paracaedimonas acanthamoebae]|nr:hypothetical protein IM40_06035 [Candidatus Paracaedimonas acanthamoebae]